MNGVIQYSQFLCSLGLDYRDQDYVISKIEQFYHERLYESEKVKEAQQAWSAKLI